MKKLFQKIMISFLLSMMVLPQAFAAVSTSTTFRVFLTVNQETPPPPGGGGGAGTTLPIIFDIVATPSSTGATITYKTNILTTSSVSYGESVSFGGFVSDGLLSTNHSVFISNLTPNTTYYFSIDAKSQTGANVNSGILNFKTLTPQPVVNALSFKATARTEDIKLDWRMATGQEDDTVRIVRSIDFYPTDINEGETIFEGANQSSTIDSEVTKGVRYYYTLFIKDENGKYSSGAVADAIILLEGQVEPEGDLFDRLSKAPYVDPRIASLTLNDFVFSQPDREDFSTSGGENLFVEGDKNLTIKLSYDRVPEILKTVAITLADPDDQTRKFTFLLKVNDEKTFYAATIAPLGRSGEYKLSIAIVDYKNQGLKKITGSLLAVVSRAFEEEGIFQGSQGFNTNDLMVSIIVVLAMIALSYVSARRIDFSYLMRAWSRFRPRRRI